MDAFRGRSQTTKGIWIANCVGIDPFTVAMDLEGTDGRERGEDDTTFEKQSALFALAIADIVLINMWCHDIGREQAANKPLLKTVFQVMMRLFSPRKTTQLFVVRDKTKVWTNIWNAVSKPKSHKDTPLSEFFNVEVTALSSFKEKEDLFKEQHFFKSIFLGGFAGDRQGVVPAAGFSFSAQQTWRVIKENKDLDLLAHKVISSSLSFYLNIGLLALEEVVQSGPVFGFGRRLSSILETYFRHVLYDIETFYFDHGVRNAKRKQLESKALDMLSKGEGFAASICTSTESCMLEFDQGCADAAIKQANWDASKVKEKLHRDINAHALSVQDAKLSELMVSYEKQLGQSLSEPVESLFDNAGRDTWASIRKLLTRETEIALSEFSAAISSFGLDRSTVEKMLQDLKDYARNVVERKAREEAGKVLIRMKDRQENLNFHIP
ncbi:hypothetical protein PVK06_021007 [Gossypium arboreum]|uniref:GB1/RHD3-type G domain-containing protein n=2 Tax=Gossypium arboreum TaxID=29729 RepID=A0ABR0PNV3_GOSAR|nr:hypothetical protein PVK06_021007 [Gossypium arboreum]